MFGHDVEIAAQAHAVQEFPKEAVGYVVDGVYKPLFNISATPEKTFEVNKSIWAQLESEGRKIMAVIHSHPKSEDAPEVDYPSRADMRSQIDTCVPWGIITCDKERASKIIWFGDGVAVPPLSGPERYFRHGITDCYSLIRDYYKETFNIVLKEFPRDWNWWNLKDEGGDIDLYADGFAKTGFREIRSSELKPGDVFLAQLPRIPVVCHGGIYLGGAGDMILHHLCSGKPVDFTRLAAREPGVRYLKYVVYYLRHEVVDENYKTVR